MAELPSGSRHTEGAAEAQQDRGAAGRAFEFAAREQGAGDGKAGRDQEQGPLARFQAAADRELRSDRLGLAAYDPLTGARARGAGLIDLDNELQRCLRTRASLIVVYVDVVGTTRVEAGERRGAGDELLRRVVALIQEHLRSYDLVIRLDGDAFACAMSNMTLADVQQRFGHIAAAFASAPGGGCEVRSGFAEFTGEETATVLIERADRDLVARST